LLDGRTLLRWPRAAVERTNPPKTRQERANTFSKGVSNG
jgi:hypothetical protein